MLMGLDDLSSRKAMNRWLRRRLALAGGLSIGHGEGAGSAAVSARKGLEPAGKYPRRWADQGLVPLGRAARLVLGIRYHPAFAAARRPCLTCGD